MLTCDICSKECKTPAGLGAHRKRSHNVGAECGTVGGYLAHRRNKEQADRDCLAAWSRYARTPRKKK